MSSIGTFAPPEELEALRSLSRAQAAAARAGDLEGLERALAARQHLLDALRGRQVGPDQLDEVGASDGETRTLLEGWIQGVEATLARIHLGHRALGGYHVRLGAPHGFVNQLQ